MNKIKSILATKIPAWEFMGEEEQNIVAFEIFEAVNLYGFYHVGSFKIDEDDLDIKLNGEVMSAELALTEVSTRLVYTYRDLFELKALKWSIMGEAQISYLERQVAELEHEMNRISTLLKYDADLTQAMLAQCEHHASRLAQVA
jgi:hypothetical protein